MHAQSKPYHHGSLAEAILARAAESKVASTALVTAIEMLEGAACLPTTGARRLRLLTAFNASDREGIAEEVERRLP